MTSRFGLTLNRIKEPHLCMKRDLDSALESLSKRADYFKLIDKTYEVSSNNYLHMHALIELRTNQFRKKLKLPGHQVFIKKITDEEGWINYMHKEAKTPEIQWDILDTHAFQECVFE